ncbi:hypothetical protein J8273_3006 [Carpediemonas membranifera]|uniref:Uncharacterized protein n=1 Tax=Carpediemonas membranifera TaxID=201153 RepID=A0A8J6E0R2_9EUKA|nr:hypothetical protein J8273_3006 [Carpediemonas membranifera]|eukprot:KAG9395439.1 hypothetical protein J8273_3006 [Carpediemonas membranifera]
MPEDSTAEVFQLSIDLGQGGVVPGNITFSVSSMRSSILNVAMCVNITNDQIIPLAFHTKLIGSQYGPNAFTVMTRFSRHVTQSASSLSRGGALNAAVNMVGSSIFDSEMLSVTFPTLLGNELPQCFRPLVLQKSLSSFSVAGSITYSSLELSISKIFLVTAIPPHLRTVGLVAQMIMSFESLARRLPGSPTIEVLTIPPGVHIDTHLSTTVAQGSQLVLMNPAYPNDMAEYHALVVDDHTKGTPMATGAVIQLDIAPAAFQTSHALANTCRTIAPCLEKAITGTVRRGVCSLVMPSTHSRRTTTMERPAMTRQERDALALAVAHALLQQFKPGPLRTRPKSQRSRGSRSRKGSTRSRSTPGNAMAGADPWDDVEGGGVGMEVWSKQTGRNDEALRADQGK